MVDIQKYLAKYDQVLLDRAVYLALKARSESVSQAAISMIWDRRYGKPVQSLEHSGPGGGPIETLTTIEAGGRVELETFMLEFAKAGAIDAEYTTVEPTQQTIEQDSQPQSNQDVSQYSEAQTPSDKETK